MLSSIFMTSALAAIVLASPMQHFDKREPALVVVTAPAVTVTDVVATVTAANGPVIQPAANSPAANSPAANSPVVNQPAINKEADNGGWGHGHGGYSQASPAPPTQTYAPTTTTTQAQQQQQQPSSPAPAAQQPGSSTGPASSAYSDVAIYHHNIHRTNHSAPAMTWNDTLVSSAQTIADSCVYAHNTAVDGGGYGQNIAAGVQSDNISAIITDMFYNGEEPFYPGYGAANPDMSNFEKWGHFSQIVWKDSTSVGCATQYCPNGLANTGSDVSPYFTVCNYYPAGNYGGEYGDNVLQPKGEPTAQWNTGLSN